MAKFHAVPVAMRLLRSEIFDEKIRPYLKRINLYEEIDTNSEIIQVSLSLCTIPFFSYSNFIEMQVWLKCMYKTLFFSLKKSLYASVDKINGLDANLRQKVLNQLKECSDWRNKNSPAQDTPYTGISHCDLWTNNIMYTCGKLNLNDLFYSSFMILNLISYLSFSADSLGRIDKVKFCDYQLMTYDSFANDLVFFVFTSIYGSNRKGNIEHFFQHYHKHFYQTLSMLNCPLNDYTYEK